MVMTDEDIKPDPRYPNKKKKVNEYVRLLQTHTKTYTDAETHTQTHRHVHMQTLSSEHKDTL